MEVWEHFAARKTANHVVLFMEMAIMATRQGENVKIGNTGENEENLNEWMEVACEEQWESGGPTMGKAYPVASRSKAVRKKRRRRMRMRQRRGNPGG